MPAGAAITLRQVPLGDLRLSLRAEGERLVDAELTGPGAAAVDVIDDRTLLAATPWAPT